MGSTLGERIKLVRGSMTQSEFAKAINCPQAYISRYENGVVKPSIEFVYNLIKTFNVSLDWFMKGEGEVYDIKGAGRKSKTDPELIEIITLVKNNQKATKSIQKFLRHKRSIQLMDLFGDMPDDKIKALITLLN